ncbi:MAG: SDR family oxidoreductase [Clostridiales bacterium]|nr:SDR family oxidoreductase [Clostridiales bacterium]OPZ68574.1 MAG: Glucose 1-dehydrogenase 2 [Firmicutes bacterium ADurb.Bin467]
MNATYLQSIFGLEGKVALVTGGGRGIGQFVACELSKAGAEIVILVRSDFQETVDMIRAAGGRAWGIRCDVTKQEDVRAAIGEIVERSGRLDIVFNNAGVCVHKSAFESTIEEFREVVDINLTGEYIVAVEAARAMIKLGIRGSIINMASMSAGIVNLPQWQASYNASKAGVIHMTRSLAMEWIEHGIRVNSISPGYIATPMSTDVPEDLKQAWYKLIPMGRMGWPSELIPPILYLASPASGYTTGTDVLVDGGYSCV